MPIILKDGFQSRKYVQAAAERRAADQDHVIPSSTDIDLWSRIALSKRDNHSTHAPVIPGKLMNPISWMEFVRDSKMTVGVLSSQSQALEEEIRQSSKSAFSVLDDIQREVQALDSFITEEEIKLADQYTSVHYNSFVRSEDAERGYSDDWIVDYKTQISFMPQNVCDVIPGTGFTLPVRYDSQALVAKASLVGEGTDFGDGLKPLVSTDPMHLVQNDRIFRHVVILRDFDDTSRKYEQRPGYCTIQLELSGLQLVNYLTVRPVGNSVVYLSELSYINEAGAETVLSSVDVSNGVELTVAFEPIRTKFIKLKFKQFAAVARAYYSGDDIRVSEINKLLRGAGFSQLLSENSEPVKGRVYDFSMQGVRVGLREYENLGVFRGQPLSVASPVGVAFTDVSERIDVSIDAHTYGTESFLNANEVVSERYLGIDLKTASGGTAFKELVPVPDGATQREFLPVAGSQCKAKLFPDLFYTFDKSNRISSYQFIGGSAYITFAQAHGFGRTVSVEQTDELVVVAGSGEGNSAYNISSFSWKQVDDYSVIAVPNTVAPTTATYNGDFVPFAFLMAAQARPISVYMENTLLSLGTDYEISLDSGSTWSSRLPVDGSWWGLRSSARAGVFKIRFTDYKPDRIYWCEYKPVATQTLGSSPGVMLRNGRVSFERSLIGSSGTVTGIIVSRADSVNPYLTPITRSYLLQVKEYVS